MRPANLLMLTLLVVSGCSILLAPAPAPIEPRPAVYVAGASFAKDVTNGLSHAERKAYYSMDEGIHWLPVDVLLSLKRPTDNFGVYDELFLARPERLGLAPNIADPTSDLPLGITVSEDPVPMAGINCATCHTSVISNASGAFFIVDGGSGQFAIDRFIEGMIKSLVGTLINPAEFEAFYQRYKLRAVLRGGPVVAKQGEDELDDGGLSEDIEEAFKTGDLDPVLAALESKSPGMLKAGTFGAPPSPGELSSRTGMFFYLTKRFVFFFQQVEYATPAEGVTATASGLGRSNPWGVTKKMFGAHMPAIKDGAKPVKSVVEGGPINTPHVWDHERQKWIFWTGVTNSMLERNMAQGIALVTDFDWGTMTTTIKVKKLEEVSKLARKPKAPSWPAAILGTIDLDLAAKGKEIFKAQCLTCHDPKASFTSPGSAEFGYYDVGTDDSYYKGQIEMMGPYELFADVLTPMMTKAKARAAKVEEITDLAPFEVGRTPVVWRKPTGNKFVAKPLAGIWATAPYLHNGSVPTIDDLLQPVEKRPAEFLVGGFVYDSKKLGFVTDASDPRAFKLVTNEPGNSNDGHEFVVSDADRPAVLEFLKSYDATTTF